MKQSSKNLQYIHKYIYWTRKKKLFYYKWKSPLASHPAFLFYLLVGLVLIGHLVSFWHDHFISHHSTASSNLYTYIHLYSFLVLTRDINTHHWNGMECKSNTPFLFLTLTNRETNQMPPPTSTRTRPTNNIIQSNPIQSLIVMQNQPWNSIK